MIFVKKTISFLLAVCMMFSALISCSQQNDNQPSAAEGNSMPISSEQTSEESQSTDTTYVEDDLPEIDLDGWTFRIYNTVDYKRYLHSEELTGEVINDAVYNANLKVMDRFNVNIETIIANDTSIKSSVLSGSDDFDISMMHDVSAGSESQQGLCLNVRELPYINFEKPWWPEFTVDSLTVLDKMYLVSSFISYLGMDWTRVIFFNIDKMNDYDIELPYNDVRNGTWTLDKLQSITKDIYEDLDGNSEQTYDDFFGFALTGPFYCWLEAFDIEPYGKDDATVLKLDVNNDKMLTLCEKVYSWLYESRGCYYSPSDSGNYAEDNYLGMFSAGKSLFTYGVLERLILTCRDSDINYGILPMPKLDENQSEYYSGCTDRPIVIPKTNSNHENTGLMLEAMSAEGYRTVLPAYYETALKWKYSNDNDSAEMLDIIFQNRRISLAYIYGSEFSLSLGSAVTESGSEWASYYAKKEKSEQKRMEKTIEFFSGQ